MASLIDIVIRGRDLSGPAFASAAGNLQRLTAGAARGTTEVRQLGVATSQSGTQAATGLARVEQQAEGTASAIITLGIAGSTTQTRIRSLTISIQNQQEALILARRRLDEVRASHDADSLAVGRAQLAYDRLNRALTNNQARLQELRQSGDVSGISVVGVGGRGGAAGAAGAGLGGFLAGAQGAAAGFGIGLGTEQAGQLLIGALGQANAYTRIDTTLRSLVQTQEQYNEAIAVARTNQRLYGGALGDQEEAVAALIPFLRTTNAELKTLDLTTKLLATRNQREGLGGAAYALQEFLTSDTAEGGTSVAERFNLQRSAVTAIIKRYADDEQGRLLALQDLLAQQGITQATIAAQVNGADAPFRTLEAAWNNFLLREGQAAQNLFGSTAEWTAGLLNLISGAAPVDESLRQIGTGLQHEFGYGRTAAVAAGVPTSGPQRVAVTAPGAQAAGVNNNYYVQGSLVTERQLANQTRTYNQQTAKRNGMSSR